MRTLSTALVALLLAVDAPGQTASGPQGLRPAGGNGRIVGRVVDAATGRGIARATVRLEGPRAAPAPVGTDETGAFEFVDVPACTCAIAIDKAGYVPSRYPDAAPTYRRTTRRFTLASGETLADLVVPMYRGGSIAGRVVDAFGDPVESATVQVLRIGGDGQPQPRAGGTTDDRGEFRVPRLEPGRYLLFVAHRNRPDDPHESQPVPTFFPGVLDAAQAQFVQVDRGQAVTGVEWALVSGTTAWVSGVVLDEYGAPVQSGRVVGSARRLGTGSIDHGQFPIDVAPDGSFRVRLPPGDYEIEARTSQRPAVGQPTPADERVGALPVTVSGAPLGNLAVQLGAGVVMSGRVVFEGSGVPPGRVDVSEVLVASFTAPVGERCRRGGVQASRGRRAAVDTDENWNFQITGLFGTCIATLATSNLGNWSVAAAYAGDTDILDKPVTFEPGRDIRDVRVVLTDHKTELEVRVTDEHDVPTREYVALVFSVDATRWHGSSRFVRVFQPSTRGETATAPPTAAPGRRGASADRLSDLPRGEYYAVALDDLPFDAPRNPDSLERLARSATRLTIGTTADHLVSLRRVAFASATAR